ncbi:MAG TPA: DUF4350 domain-containing protein [Bryobacteraceae bacterium]
MSGKFAGIFSIVLLAAFFIALMKIATLPLESGEAYPAYSSLRSDPLGTKALYESLAALGDRRVERNFDALPKLKGIEGTVLLLGEQVNEASAWSEQELKFYESIVNAGGQLVIAFLPVPPRSATANRKRPHQDFVPAIVKRWHMKVEWHTGTENEIDEAGSLPRQSNAYFVPEDKSGWIVRDLNKKDEAVLVEHRFGEGKILLLTNSYPLSNEGLRSTRPVSLIETIAGPAPRIIFDESHLGVANTGSVGTLIRRYRLTGAFAVLLLLAALFLWKNSSSLLPQSSEPQSIEAAAGADSHSGLVNLLKRSVPSTQLARACLDRWKETRALGRPVSDQRAERVEAVLAAGVAAGPGEQAALYRKIQTILTEKL